MTEVDALPDDEVVRRVLAGDVDKFELIVNRYQDKIYNLVWGMVRDPGHAEDLVQDIFVKAYRKLGDFEQKSRLYTWLYRISVNRTLDFLKGRDRVKTSSLEEAPQLEPEAEAVETDPVGPLLEREFIEKMEEALEAIPDKFREILVLREVQGLSYEEIAEVLQCSKGTVESRLFRARARLKEKLKSYCSP
jgi:RNA polymerase sigma-70 factor (ECF subfamily)